MTKKQTKIMSIAIMCAIVLLAVATIVMPKKEYSENENRYLASLPEMSLDNIKDNTFMKGLEDYAADHFAGRDIFMTVKYDYERVTGRNQINGVYICEDDFYIKEYKTPANTRRIIAAVNRLANGRGEAKLHVMLVPTAVTIYSDKLPATAKNASQLDTIAEIIEGIQKENSDIDIIDVTEILNANKDSEQLFYRLDHHWTTVGAYYAYTECCRSLGFEPLPREHFDEKLVSSEFKGSFYSDVNNTNAKADEMYAFLSDSLDLTVTYYDKKLVSDSLYEESYLGKKDKYSYFLNNQNAFVEIANKKAESSKELVLVKDSYANCFVPFLAEHYSKIYVFDTRYYREKVTEFVQSHEAVTDILFLYNMCTIDTDTGIAGIK